MLIMQLQTNYFCLQSDIEIKNSFQGKHVLNLQFTFKLLL
jgi:hypothetical protein